MTVRVPVLYALFFAALGVFLVASPDKYTITPAHSIAFEMFTKPGILGLHLAAAVVILLGIGRSLYLTAAGVASIPLFWAYVTTLPKIEAGMPGFNGIGTSQWIFLGVLGVLLVLYPVRQSA